MHASFVDCTRAPLWEPGGPLDPSTPLPLHGAPPPPRDFWSTDPTAADFWSAQPEGGAPLQGDGDSSQALAWRVPAAAPTVLPTAPPAAPIAPPHAAARTHFWTAVPSGVSSVVMNHWRELRQAEGGAEGGGGGGGEREAGGGGMRGGGGGGGGSEGARGPETVDSFPLECVWEQIDARTVHAVEACAAAAALRAPPPPPPPPPRTASTARSTAHPAAAAARGARRTDLFGEGRIAGDGSLQGMHLYSSPPRAAVPRAAVPPPPAVEPASATSTARTLPPQKEEDDWVQCEACLKWRRLPPGVPPPADDEPWRCEMSADAARQTCAAEEELETNRTDTKLWAGAEAAGWVARRRGNYNWVYIAPGGGKFSSVVKARRSAGRPEPRSTALQLPQPLQPPPNVLPSAPAHASPPPAAPPPLPPPPPAMLGAMPPPAVVAPLPQRVCLGRPHGENTERLAYRLARREVAAAADGAASLHAALLAGPSGLWGHARHSRALAPSQPAQLDVAGGGVYEAASRSGGAVFAALEMLSEHNDGHRTLTRLPARAEPEGGEAEAEAESEAEDDEGRPALDAPGAAGAGAAGAWQRRGGVAAAGGGALLLLPPPSVRGAAQLQQVPPPGTAPGAWRREGPLPPPPPPPRGVTSQISYSMAELLEIQRSTSTMEVSLCLRVGVGAGGCGCGGGGGDRARRARGGRAPSPDPPLDPKPQSEPDSKPKPDPEPGLRGGGGGR